MTDLLILDISKWEEDPTTLPAVDFMKMRASGVSGCIMKATGSYGGVCYTDKAYQKFVIDCGTVMPHGSYHFLDKTGSGVIQARYYWDAIKYSRELIVPCLDVEGYPYGDLPSDVGLRILCLDFLMEIERLSGMKPMIYTNSDILKRFHLAPGNPLLKYPLWLSHPGSTAPVSADFAPWDKVSLWQFTYKGDAHSMGIPDASGVDCNYLATEDAGAIIKTTIPTIGGNMLYDTNANGIMLWSSHTGITAANLSKYDFVVSAAWDGKNVNPEFANHCQAAYDAKIPFIALVKPWLQDYPGIGSAGVDANLWQAHWPQFAKDDNCQKIDSMLFMGDHALKHKRAISTVIVDLSDTSGNTGILPAGWLTYAARYFEWYLSERGYSWYTLWSNEIVTQYKDIDKGGEISTFLTGDAQGTSIKAFVPVVKNSGGLSVPSTVPVRPELPGAHVPYSTKWYWWWFTTTAVTGIISPVAEFIYNGTSAQMRKDLNYSSGTTPIPDPFTPPVVTTGARAEILAVLDKYKVV